MEDKVCQNLQSPSECHLQVCQAGRLLLPIALTHHGQCHCIVPCPCGSLAGALIQWSLIRPVASSLAGKGRGHHVNVPGSMLSSASAADKLAELHALPLSWNSTSTSSPKNTWRPSGTCCFNTMVRLCPHQSTCHHCHVFGCPSTVPWHSCDISLINF